MKRTREIADIQRDMDHVLATYRALVLEVENHKVPPVEEAERDSVGDVGAEEEEESFSMTEEGDASDRPLKKSRVCGACGKTFTPSRSHQGTKCYTCKKKRYLEGKRKKLLEQNQ
jgi:NADH pyrophosphatase NudC (nudix superfamily)